MNNPIEKILKAIPKSSRDPLFIIEVNGNILYANNQGEELLRIAFKHK